MIPLESTLEHAECVLQNESIMQLPCILLNLWLRPLQINSLFPIPRPHLVTVGSKYSIIPVADL